MGHNNNYTDYSKINKHKEENETEKNEIIDEVIDETITEDSIAENTDEIVINEEDQVIENSVPESTNVIGIVVDCDLLNIRQRPEADAHILGTIKKDEEIQVEKDATDPDNRFYKIVTASGVHGYCMKQFIELRGE